MTQNLGRWDRIARLLAVLALTTCAVGAPFTLQVRLLAFAAPAVYLLATSLFGTCLGYRLLGRSTCPATSS
jgi:hypothetical protein